MEWQKASGRLESCRCICIFLRPFQKSFQEASPPRTPPPRRRPIARSPLRQHFGIDGPGLKGGAPCLWATGQVLSARVLSWLLRSQCDRKPTEAYINAQKGRVAFATASSAYETVPYYGEKSFANCRWHHSIRGLSECARRVVNANGLMQEAPHIPEITASFRTAADRSAGFLLVTLSFSEGRGRAQRGDGPTRHPEFHGRDAEHDG